LDSAIEEINLAENYFLAKLFERVESIRNFRTIFLSALSLIVAIVLGIRSSIGLSVNQIIFVDVLLTLLVISAGGILISELVKSRLNRAHYKHRARIQGHKPALEYFEGIYE
jgi:spore maturation protein SpmA